MPSTIADLPTLPAPMVGTDLFVVVRGGIAYKAAASVVAQYVQTASSIVPASEPFRGALAHLTTNWTGIVWPAVIAWQAESYDSDSIWGVGAPTRLTVPTGVTKVRLVAGVRFEAMATAGSIYVEVYKNGAALPIGGPAVNLRQGATGTTENVVNLVSPVLNVVAGDYFEVYVNASMAAQDQVLAGAGSFFGMEVVEMQP